MKKFFNDLTTGKDNETHDVVRVLMLAIVASLVVLLWLGSGTYLYGYYTKADKPFDIQTFFTSTSTFALGVAAFMMGGAASILLKKDTEPNGKTEETTSITSGGTYV